MADWRTFNYRRFGLQAAFWAVMGIILLMILSNFVNLSNTNQLSAYDDDWNDMSAFREDIKKMGVEHSCLVKNDDRFVSMVSWSFDHWLSYLRTNAQPPTKITVFDKITLFVNGLIYRRG